MRKTVEAGGAIASFAIFLVIFAVVSSGEALGVEAGLFRAVNSVAALPLVSIVAFAVTQFGSEFIVAAIGVAVYVSSRDNKKLGLPIIVAIVISDVALFLVKSSYFRPRPYEVLSGVNLPFGRDGGSSFPSGHTTRAFAFAPLFPLLKGRKYSPTIILAIFVGLTRVVIGVHFPFDVLGGASLGIGLAFLMGLLLGPIRKIIPRLI